MKNKAIGFLAAFMLAAALAGCAPPPDDGVGTVIGVSLKSMQDQFSLTFKREAEEAAAAYGDVKIIAMDAGGSSKKQASDIFFLSEQKADALIVVSDDQEYTGRQMRSARAKGIYVAYVGQDEQDQNVDVHIYLDYGKVGAMVAQWIAAQSGGDAVTLEVCCHPETKRCADLSEGFYRQARAYGNIDMAYTCVGYDNKLTTISNIRDSDLYGRDPAPGYVFAHSDEMALAAAAYAGEKGLDVSVISAGGLDGAATGLAAAVYCPPGACDAVDIIMNPDRRQQTYLELEPVIVEGAAP